jgi:DNA-directed RNA polymerase sigma subunit (sigma70/sigma32)
VGAQRNRHEDEDSFTSADADAAVLRELMREARAMRPLRPGETATLLDRSALGDKTSQERLVAANLDMVIRLAVARGQQRLSVPDLVQEGSIGLVEAVRFFAASGEPDFVPFAEKLVAAKMDDAIAAEAEAVRDAELLVAAATDYERTEVLRRRELHHDPTASELAEKLEWTIDRTRYVAQVVADARRRHDEELLAFIDPEAIDLDDDEPLDLDG